MYMYIISRQLEWSCCALTFRSQIVCWRRFKVVTLRDQSGDPGYRWPGMARRAWDILRKLDEFFGSQSVFFNDCAIWDLEVQSEIFCFRLFEHVMSELAVANVCHAKVTMTIMSWACGDDIDEGNKYWRTSRAQVPNHLGRAASIMDHGILMLRWNLMVETPSNFGSICGEEKIFNIWFASMFDLLEEVKH